MGGEIGLTRVSVGIFEMAPQIFLPTGWAEEIRRKPRNRLVSRLLLRGCGKNVRTYRKCRPAMPRY
jgi:hypothetical protein